MLAELNGLLFSVSVIISSASRAGLQKVNHKYIILYVPKTDITSAAIESVEYMYYILQWLRTFLMSNISKSESSKR